MPITIVFSAIGGPIAGFVKDSTGTYSPVWILSAVFLSIASIIMLFTLEPIPPEDKN
jgi:cyanate permease